MQQPDVLMATKARDPVCGMQVDPATSRHQLDHHGVRHHFCGAGCRTRFAADPDRYLKPRTVAPAPPGASYTCPMHPEIRNAGPGNCPICGMALEPVEVSAEAAPNHELRDMTRRFWVGLALAAPVLALEMSGHLGARLLPPSLAVWIQFALATPVVLWAGWPFFQRGWMSVANRSPNMFTLIALGTGAAYLYSLVATFAPGIFPAGFRGMGGTVPVYYEPAAVIVVLVLLGQVLELRARDRAGDAIRALLNLAPKTARRLTRSGGDEDIPVDRVQVGDRLRIRPGEGVPVDGVVLDGDSAVDEAMVTGEASPSAKSAGGRLVAGTVNGTGALVMRAERVGSDTMLARIVAMVAEAQRSRAPIQRLADRVAGWFVPAVLGIAILAFVIWATFGPSPALSYGLIAAVSVLIIACPCALGLAAPMSIGVGVAAGARGGILITSAEALERLEQVNTLLIDKTGTLTEGRPTVTAILTAPGISEAELLGVAAAIERSSEHPLAAAIVAAATKADLPVPISERFRSVTGKGVTATVAGRIVVLGNAAMMADAGVTPGDLEHQADQLRRDGATALYVAVAGRIAGVVAVADPIRPTTPDAIATLKRAGIWIVMLTGDNRVTAEAVARALVIGQVEADASPADKARVVARLKAEGRVVAMAGDGVNDAPALASADVGIAMGTGTEVAIQSAGMTLVRGDLAGIVRARALSRATMRNIRQNLVFAFLYNAIGIPVAAGALYPAFHVLLSPEIAALAMSLSSVSVIANALRLRSVRL